MEKWILGFIIVFSLGLGTLPHAYARSAASFVKAVSMKRDHHAWTPRAVRAKRETFDSDDTVSSVSESHSSLLRIENKLIGRHVSKCIAHDLVYPCVKYRDPEADEEEISKYSGEPFYVLKSPFPPLVSLRQLGVKRKKGTLLDNQSQEIAAKSWAPVNEVDEGQEILDRGKTLASSRELFGCEPADRSGSCSFIATSPQKADSSITLSLCIVSDPVESSAPMCQPFALYDHDRSWIAVIRTVATNCDCGGFSDEFDLAIVSEFSMRDYTQDIISSISTALSSAPLLMRVRLNRNGDRITGLSQYKSSQVLRGWNELSRVDIEIGLENPCGVWKDLESLCFTYSVALWINKQKDSTPSNWTMPSDLQSKQYESAVRNSLKHGLENLCTSGQWVDDAIFLCKKKTGAN